MSSPHITNKPPDPSVSPVKEGAVPEPAPADRATAGEATPTGLDDGGAPPLDLGNGPGTVDAELFGAPQAQRNGASVSIKAVFPPDSPIEERYRRVRNEGITNNEELALALDYLAKLNPVLQNIINIVKHRMDAHQLTIEVRNDQKTHSYANPSFQGKVDRTTSHFGQAIVLHKNALPDVLLHEILHCLPLEIVQTLFSIPFDFPPIHPDLSYQDLVENIAEHIRLNETLSFGVMQLLYDIEEDQGITPDFTDNVIFKEINKAWHHDGLKGIRKIFETYFQNYEKNIAKTSLIMALIVKGERRTDLTPEEEALIHDSSQNDYPGEQYVKFFQKAYFKRVRQLAAKGISFPAGQYDISAMLARGIYNPTEALSSLFDKLDQLEKIGETEIDPPSTAQAPQEASHSPLQGHKQTLLASYQATIARVLTEQPRSLSHGEITALISWIRLAKTGEIKKLIPHLYFYIDEKQADLFLRLAFEIYRRGFVTQAHEIIDQIMARHFRPDFIEPIFEIMDEKAALKAIETCLSHVNNHHRQTNIGAHMSTLANTQSWNDDQRSNLWSNINYYSFIFSACGLKNIYNSLKPSLSMPDNRREWRWLVQGTDQSSYKHEFKEAPWKLYLKEIDVLRRRKNLPPHIVSRLDQIWEAHRDWLRSAYTTLNEIMSFTDNEDLIYLVADNSEILGLFSDSDLEIIFQSFSEEKRKIAMGLAQKDRFDIKDDKETTKKIIAEIVSDTSLDTHENLRSSTSMSAVKLAVLNEILQSSYEKNGGDLTYLGLSDEEISKIEQFAKTQHAFQLPDSYLALMQFHPFRQDSLDRTRTANSWTEFGNDMFSPFGTQEEGPRIESGLLLLTHLKSGQPQTRYQYALETLRNLLYDNSGLWGLTDLSNDRRDGNMPLSERVDQTLAPLAIYFHRRALKEGEMGIAQGFYDFLFREIPRTLQDKVEFPVIIGRGQRRSAISRSFFMAELSSYEWRLQMDRERHILFTQNPKNEEDINVWFARINKEIERGSPNITWQTLYYFTEEFQEDKVEGPYLVRLYESLNLKIITDPSMAAVHKLVESVHKSPLSAEAKDGLFHDLFGDLLELAKSASSTKLDYLSLVRWVAGWKTPFDIDAIMKDYPRTEALLAVELAGFDPLTNQGKAYDEHLRLEAFALAGIVLHRNETKSNVDNEASVVPEFVCGYNEVEVLQSMGLVSPHDPVLTPFSRDHLYGPKPYLKEHCLRVLTYLRQNQTYSQAQRESILKLIDRLMAFDDEGVNSAFAEWLTSKDAISHILYLDILKLFFKKNDTFGETKRQTSITLLNKPNFLPRTLKRRLFEWITRKVWWSPWVQDKLENLKKDPKGTNETDFMVFLLKVYDCVVAEIPDDFMLDRLNKDNTLLSQWLRTGDTSMLPKGSLLHIEKITDDALDTLKKEKCSEATMPVRTRHDLVMRVLFMAKAICEVAPTTPSLNLAETLKPDLVKKNPALFGRALLFPGETYQTMNPSILEERLRLFSIMLSRAGWVEVFDWLQNKQGPNYLGLKYTLTDIAHRVIPSDLGLTADNSWSWQDFSRAIDSIENKFATIEGERLIFEAANLKDEDLPDFIRQETGLKKDLLVWLFQILDPVAKTIFLRKLKDANTDEEKIKLLGEASHLEKLLQLASVHPAVPKAQQEILKIFQKHVPPRDPLDVKATIELSLEPWQLAKLTVDLANPLSEGTIGGVYRAIYDGNEIVLKVIPQGKRRDLTNSLASLQRLRLILMASEYKNYGSHTLEHLLSFYERVIVEEIDLRIEHERAQRMRALVQGLPGFHVPAYREDLSTVSVAAMENLPPYDLMHADLATRKQIAEKIESELLPAMIWKGLFHYDLHPGNMGVRYNSENQPEVVIYDMGRVCELDTTQQATLMSLYGVLSETTEGAFNMEAIIPLLRQMGKVTDEEKFRNMAQVFSKTSSSDPVTILEAICPELAEYGLELDDTYVKLLLMFVTWNGTKRELLNETSLLAAQTLPSRTPPVHIDTPRSGSSDTLRTTQFHTSTLIGMPAIAPNSGETNLLEGPWPQDPLAQNIPVNLVTEGATALKPKPETTKHRGPTVVRSPRQTATRNIRPAMTGLSKFSTFNRTSIPRFFSR